MGVGSDILLRSFGAGGLEEISRVELLGPHKYRHLAESVDTRPKRTLRQPHHPFHGFLTKWKRE
ncbi:hypothetical protein QC763_0015320 [Podospora pseudopauciseta]|uniref:Uncharacterized protein n=2 Tax=Podospora TaxID=5144 RepID=A0ABR0HZL0_9PEZI|nr:hypothetical protein QC763_0015320 [Podospora pseudopauciseta]KAK4682065.1 hypothetical protein QC764_0015340 [Podospora pseudoanserina]